MKKSKPSLTQVAQAFSREQLKDAVVKSYPLPEYATMKDVPSATGTSNGRICDVLVMECYPSRGLHLLGFEVITSRSEWKAELTEPDKAEAMGKYCTYWNVVANQGVVPVAELPLSWGLIEVGGVYDPADPSVMRCQSTQVKPPLPNPDIQPVDMRLLAAIMRRANRLIEDPALLSKEVQRVARVEYKKGLQQGLARRQSELDSLLRELQREHEARRDIEALLGITLKDLPQRHGSDKLGQDIQMVLNGELDRWEDQINLMRRTMAGVLGFCAEWDQVQAFKKALKDTA